MMRSDTRRRNNTINTTEIIQACRVCLAMDRKLYEMTDKNNLMQCYLQISGLHMVESLPHHICWECSHRLQSCINFRRKAVQGHNVMMNILQKKLCLTTQNISTIDRIKNGLSSNLTIKKIDVNHNDLHVHDAMPLNYEENEISNDLDKTDPIDQIDYEVEPKNAEVEADIFNGEIKAHNIYVGNTDPINEHDFGIKEERDEIEVEDENDFNERIKNDRLYYTNDDTTIDFDIDNTSSSDTILPVRNKTKKVKKLSRKKMKLPKIKVDKRRKPANEVLSEDLFTITDLSLDEQLAEIVNRQHSANYKNAVFKCTTCFKGFVDEDAYNGHMIRHTDQSGKYECEICKIRFKQPHAKRNHAASHLQRFSCKCCPYVSTRRNAAKLHEQWHNGTRYQCPHCEEDFDKFSTYMGHIRIKHPSDIVCHQCGYSFVSEKGLGLHRKLKHRFDEREVPSEGPHCEQCNVRFVSQEAYENHLKLSLRHNEINGGRKRTRKTRDTQQKNKDVKENVTREKKKRNAYKPDEPIPCEQCELQLPDSLSYYRHFRRAHPGMNRTNYPSMKSKSMCEVCGKMFQSLALLQDHSWTHTDSKQFKCSQCDKTFQRKYRLIAHRRLHKGPRASYVCGVCGKQFTTASNRQRHMFIHTGLKPFKCEMCGKCFKHASEKRAHITYVHLKKPWPKRARGKRQQDSKQVHLPPQAMPAAGDIDIVQPLWP